MEGRSEATEASQPAPKRAIVNFARSHEERPMAPKILSEAEIKNELAALPDWAYKAPNIEASYDFANFRDAIAFIMQIAIEAEAQNHHPEFYNSWNKVS